MSMTSKELKSSLEIIDKTETYHIQLESDNPMHLNQSLIS